MEWLEKLTPQQRATADKVKAAAQRHGIPENLALGMAMQESTLTQNKKSGTGPAGVMMIGQRAAKDMGVKNRFNEDQNIEGGVKYMKQLLKQHNGDIDKALVAYHDGPSSAFFKGGEMSPAAANHIQKVKGYAGMASPTQANAPAFKIELEDVEPLDLTGLANTTAQPAGPGRQRDITDALAATAGAGAAFRFSPERPKTHKDLEQMRIALAQQKFDLAKQQAAQAAAAQQNTNFGSGKNNWVANQYDKPIAQAIMGQPSQDAAAKLAPIREAQHARAQSMFPGMQPASPESVLYVPGQVGAGQKVMPAPAPAPAAPVTVAPTKLNFGSRAGQLGSTVAGGVAAMQANDAIQRAAEGDYLGGGLSGLSSAGAAMATAPGWKNKLIGGSLSAGSAGLQHLYDLMRGEQEKKQAPVPTYDKGGFVKKLAGAAEGPLSRIFGRSEIIQPTAQEIAQFAPRPTQQIKFSEAIAPHEGKYLGVNMSDRFGTHGKRMGGTGFPNFQNVNPLHNANDVVWMNDSQGAATKMIASSKYNGQPVIHTNYIGAPDQHASNKTVHNDILDNFYKNLAAGKISEEQIAKINAGIAARARDTGTLKQRPFSQNFDIRDKFATQEIGSNTFESRGALSRMLGTGEGVGKTKNIAVPNYEQILQSHADPLTQGAPTSSLGTRLYEVFDQPTMYSEAFHPDYRWTVHGKDQGVQFQAVPQSVGVRDFYNAYKARFPNAEPHGNAWFAYPNKPQLITEDYIRNAQDLGFAQGGLV